MKKGKVGSVVFGVIIVIVLLCMFRCTERIPAGYKGVVYNVRNGATGETVSQGLKVIPPTKEITLYSIAIEQSYLTDKSEGDSPSDESFEVPSSDGKGLVVDMTFTYKFDEDTIADTFVYFKGQSGSEIKTSFIKPNVMTWTKEVTSKYPVTEILGEKRSDLNDEITEHLKEKFEKYGIIIVEASLIDIRPDDETKAAIQKKVTAQQELELAKIEKQTAEVQANKEKEVALISAEKDKEAAVIKAEQIQIAAEAEAEATRIKAQAEAEANNMIAASLTEELIENNKIEKWTGEVPTVQGAGATIIDVGSVTSGEVE